MESTRIIQRLNHNIPAESLIAVQKQLSKEFAAQSLLYSKEVQVLKKSGDNIYVNRPGVSTKTNNERKNKMLEQTINQSKDNQDNQQAERFPQVIGSKEAQKQNLKKRIIRGAVAGSIAGLLAGGTTLIVKKLRARKARKAQESVTSTTVKTTGVPTPVRLN